MPKVVVSKSKGLVQQTGEGFELEDVSLKPSTETCSPQLVALTVTAEDANATLGGKYFDLSSTTQNYRFYFDVDNNSTAPASGGRLLVEIDVSAGDNVATVGDAVEAALEGVNAGADFEALDDNSSGTILIGGRLFGQSLNAADAGTSGFTVVDEQRGSGQKALSLDRKVSVLALDPKDIENDAGEDLTTLLGEGVAHDCTLADGTYIGQEKIIIRQKTTTESDPMEVAITNGYEEAVTDVGARTATFVANAVKPGILHLIWLGNGWLQMSAGLSAAAKGGVTGLDN